MAGSNPFLDQQARLASLIAANDYFAGLSPNQILTQKIGDLENKVLTELLPLNFGVVITTGDGKKRVSTYEALQLGEMLTVSITHNPTADQDHNVMDALWAAIQAVHGQPVADEAPPYAIEADYFAVEGHQQRLDAPPNCVVHEFYVSGQLRLL